jgi:hypothetical protein
LLVATIVCHFLYLAEGAVTGWLKLDTPEAVAVVLGILVAVASILGGLLLFEEVW